MQNVLEQGPDFWCWFNKTQFLCHCVHSIHACQDVSNPNVTIIIIHFSQIAPRVCTLVLFIVLEVGAYLHTMNSIYFKAKLYTIIYIYYNIANVALSAFITMMNYLHHHLE